MNNKGKYFINRIDSNNIAVPVEVKTKCYPFKMDDVDLFAHRSTDNPKIWVVSEFTTGLAVGSDTTKKSAIEYTESIIRQKPTGWLQDCIRNSPKLFAIASPMKVNCTECTKVDCYLERDGFFDLCGGRKFVKKEVSSPPPPLTTGQKLDKVATKLFTEKWVKYGEHCIVHKCHIRTKACNECKLEIGSEDLCKFKPVKTKNRELLKSTKHDTQKSEDFWMKRPSVRLTNFRDNSKFLGIYDPESVQDRIEAAEWTPEIPWDLKHGYPCTEWEYIAYKENPNKVQRCYAGDDSYIRESELENSKDDDRSSAVPYNDLPEEKYEPDITHKEKYIKRVIKEEKRQEKFLDNHGMRLKQKLQDLQFRNPVRAREVAAKLTFQDWQAIDAVGGLRSPAPA